MTHGYCAWTCASGVPHPGHVRLRALPASCLPPATLGCCGTATQSFNLRMDNLCALRIAQRVRKRALLRLGDNRGADLLV